MRTEFPTIRNHVAVQMDHTIVVFGGTHELKDYDDRVDYFIHNYHRRHTIWMYNLYTEKWRRYRIPKWKKAPGCLVSQACGVAIGEDIYVFRWNEFWRLTRSTFGCFSWTEILINENHKKPSPRNEVSGWEYERKLCIFGGYGQSLGGYLNEYGDFNGLCNNQLLQFNPHSVEWTSLKSRGTVPEPCYSHATTAIKEKVWLYGGIDYSNIGYNTSLYFDDLYELDMRSLTWTKIHTVGHKPLVPFRCSLNATANYKLVLHSTMSTALSKTWIVDLQSRSWKQYSSGRDHPRRCHTGSSGINNVTITFSAIAGEIDTCVFSVMLEPKSLQQLAVKTVYEHRRELSWQCLPPKLIKLMYCGNGDDLV